MAPSVAPVLVIGGGPSGLVTALTLLQNNIPVRIIDKDPNYRRGQRGVGLWPRSFEVFHFLRAHDIYRRATPMIPLREYKPGTLEPTKTFHMVAHNDPTPTVPYNNPMFLGQQAAEGILRSYMEKYGCFLELGTELQSFEDDGERILAKLVKRKDGEEIFETFEASFLVGADGAKGVTRKQLGLSFLGETRQNFPSVVGDICLRVDGKMLDRKHWHFFGERPSSFFTLLPSDEIAPDGFQFMLMSKEYEPKQLIADERSMTKCMSALLGFEINVREVRFLSEFRPNIRMVDKFGVGRVFLAGDAAHVHSPTGGQGLNSGVQDAINLAWKLSMVYKGFSPVSLLESYTSERLPVIAEMLNITTGLLNNLREASVERGMVREQRLNMLGVNCRMSPIVLDEFTHAEPWNAYRTLDETVLVAGDRAPDAPGLAVVASPRQTTAETRLFDVFSPTYHTVLVFTPDASSLSDILEALKKYPGDAVRPVIVFPQGSEVTVTLQADIVVDHGGHAYKGYLVVDGETKVVVVRPDGVVGAIVRGVEGLGQYFAKIFI